MKQFLLFACILFMGVTGYSQSSGLYSNSWGKNDFEKSITQTELKIYPNPCKTNKLILEFNKRRIAEVEIMNIAGKRILQKKYNYPENKKLILIENVPNGIYLIKTKSNDNHVVVKKLIISRN